MKKEISLFLSILLVLTGCTPSTEKNADDTNSSSAIESDDAVISITSKNHDEKETDNNVSAENSDEVENLNFSAISDPQLLTYVENNVYDNLISDFDSDEYLVEKVDAIYLSEEYIEELAYNSKSNIFFGYTLDELENEFQGKRYVFTLGDNGQTTVVPQEEIDDDTYGRIIKNVAVGTGVILICVTVSAVTVASSPAVSMIFAASATTGTTFALQSGAIGFVAATIARGYQTQDFDQAMKAGALASSEGFKWGAISGVIVGGGKEALALKGATLNGLTMKEAAVIQRESKWPIETIKSLHSEAEYKIYKKASLVPTQLPDGSWALLQKVDWNLVDDLGRTNTERVLAGSAPIDSTGTPLELHHIGQRADSPLAILTKVEHHSKENYPILHYAEEGKDISDAAWRKQRIEFWKTILKMSQGGA